MIQIFIFEKKQLLKLYHWPQISLDISARYLVRNSHSAVN